MTAQPWEPRVSRLEGAIEQIGDRLADLHGDMTALRTEVSTRIERVEARMDRVEDRSDHLDTSLNARIDRLDSKIDRNLQVTVGWMIALIAALGAFLHFVH